MAVIEIKTAEQGAEMGRKAAIEAIARMRGGSAAGNAGNDDYDVKNPPEVKSPKSTNQPSAGNGGRANNNSGDDQNNSNPGKSKGDDKSDDKSDKNAAGAGADKDNKQQNPDMSAGNGQGDASTGEDKQNTGSSGNDKSGTDGQKSTFGGNDDSQPGQFTSIYNKKENYPKVSVTDGAGFNSIGKDDVLHDSVEDILVSSGIDKSNPAWGGDGGPWANPKLAQEHVINISNDVDSEFGEKIEGKIRRADAGVVDWRTVMRPLLRRGDSIKRNDARDNTTSSIYGTPMLVNNTREKKGLGGRLAVFVDTSGSVCGTSGALNRYCSEFAKLAKDCRLKYMDLYTFNTKVYNPISGKYCHEGVLINTSNIDSDWGFSDVISGGTNYVDTFKTIYDNYCGPDKVADLEGVVYLTDTDLTGQKPSTMAFFDKMEAGEEYAESGEYSAMRRIFSKAVWLVLSDIMTNRMVDSIYDSVPPMTETERVIIMSPEDFKAQMYKITDMKRDSISEAFKLKDDEVVDNGDWGFEKIETEKTEKPEEPIDTSSIHRDVMRSSLNQARVRGTFMEEEIVKEIVAWMDKNFKGCKLVGVNSSDDKMGMGNYAYVITDDAEINITCPDGKRFAPWNTRVPNLAAIETVAGELPEHASLGTLYGDMLISGNKYLRMKELPARLMFKKVVGDIEIINMFELDNLNNLPVIEDGHELMITMSPLISNKVVDKYISDNGIDKSKISVDNSDLNFYTGKNESVNENEVMRRIKLGERYLYENYGAKPKFGNAINEKLVSKTLEDLIRKNNVVDPSTKIRLGNDFAKNVLSKVDVDWANIDDSIVTPITDYRKVVGMLGNEKPWSTGENSRDTKYGVMILTDDNDKVSAVINSGKVEDGVYIDPDMMKLINERTKLLKSIKHSLLVDHGIDYRKFLTGGKDVASTLVNVMGYIAYQYIAGVMGRLYPGVYDRNDGNGPSLIERLNHLDDLSSDAYDWVRESVFYSDNLAGMSDAPDRNQYIDMLFSFFEMKPARKGGDLVGADAGGKTIRFNSCSGLTNNLSDRNLFLSWISESSAIDLSAFFNPDILKLFILGTDIRANADGAPVYEVEDIENDSYQSLRNKYDTIKDVDVKDSILFNMTQRDRTINNSKEAKEGNTLSNFSQLLAIPDKTAKCYYIGHINKGGLNDTDIDTQEGRAKNFSMSSQKAYLDKIRASREESQSGSVAFSGKLKRRYNEKPNRGFEMQKKRSEQGVTFGTLKDLENSMRAVNMTGSNSDIEAIQPIDSEKYSSSVSINQMNKLIDTLKYNIGYDGVDASAIMESPELISEIKNAAKSLDPDFKSVGNSLIPEKAVECIGDVYRNRVVPEYIKAYERILSVPIRFGYKNIQMILNSLMSEKELSDVWKSDIINSPEYGKYVRDFIMSWESNGEARNAACKVINSMVRRNKYSALVSDWIKENGSSEDAVESLVGEICGMLGKPEYVDDILKGGSGVDMKCQLCYDAAKEVVLENLLNKAREAYNNIDTDEISERRYAFIRNYEDILNTFYKNASNKTIYRELVKSVQNALKYSYDDKDDVKMMEAILESLNIERRYLSHPDDNSVDAKKSLYVATEKAIDGIRGLNRVFKEWFDRNLRVRYEDIAAEIGKSVI